MPRSTSPSLAAGTRTVLAESRHGTGRTQRRFTLSGVAVLGTVALLAGAGTTGSASAAPAAGTPSPAPYLLRQGSVTVPVSADAYTVPTAPGRVTGAYKVLMVGSTAADRRVTYLRFDVSGVPVGAVDVVATLHVTGTPKATGGSVTLSSTASTWTEPTLDAATAPAPGTSVGTGIAPKAGAAASFPVGALTNGPYSIAVQAATAKGSVVGFVSREANAALAASLTVTYTIPPPPTLFGESVYRNGATWTAAVAAADSRYGTSAIDRVYYTGVPQTWPGDAGVIARSIVVSFKIDPVTVLSGSLDGQLSSWFAAAPTDREVFWSYFHEPEDNIAAGNFTAAQYRAAWAHLSTLAKAVENPRLHATLILMGWSLEARSGRNVADYYPGPGVLDAVGWDVYSNPADTKAGTYTDPATLYAPAVVQSAAWGLPFGFAEWGSGLAVGDTGAKRATWLTTSAAYMRAVGAAFSTYFDSPIGGPHQLLDAPSIAAYHAVVSGS